MEPTLNNYNNYQSGVMPTNVETPNTSTVPTIPQFFMKSHNQPNNPNLDNQNIYIFVKFSPEGQNNIKSNLQKVLQKTGTSIKTKLLHPIIEQNKIKFVLGITDTVTGEQRLAQFSTSGESKLNGFFINLFELLEPEDRQLLITFNDIQKEILQNKTRITDNNDFVITRLLENQSNIEKDIIARINYFKAIDVLHFEYLTLLGTIAKQKYNIYKILEGSASILSKVLNNLILKLGGNNPEVSQVTQKLILLYLIIHYSNDNDTNLKIFLFKAGIITKEEYDNYNTLIKTRTMEDISKHLMQSQIINISPNSLRNNFKNIIGEQGLMYLEGNKIENLIAFLIINKNSNLLFNTYLNNIAYKDSITNLETLILNIRSNITF